MTHTLTLVEKWEVDALRQRAEKCEELYQRTQEMERELKDARCAFGLAVLAAGGVIAIPDSEIEDVGDIEVSRFDDIANGRTVYRARRSRPRNAPRQHHKGP